MHHKTLSVHLDYRLINNLIHSKIGHYDDDKILYAYFRALLKISYSDVTNVFQITILALSLDEFHYILHIQQHVTTYEVTIQYLEMHNYHVTYITVYQWKDLQLFLMLNAVQVSLFPADPILLAVLFVAVFVQRIQDRQEIPIQMMRW
jgi:hypothetical protein